MAPPLRRQKPISHRADGARDRIVAAALKALVEGDGEFEIGDVARRAKVSVGLAYHYFGSKAGLIAVLITDFHNRHEAVVNQSFDKSLPWPVREKARLKVNIDFLYSDPVAPVMMGKLGSSAEVTAIDSGRRAAMVEMAAAEHFAGPAARIHRGGYRCESRGRGHCRRHQPGRCASHRIAQAACLRSIDGAAVELYRRRTFAGAGDAAAASTTGPAITRTRPFKRIRIKRRHHAKSLDRGGAERRLEPQVSTGHPRHGRGQMQAQPVELIDRAAVPRTPLARHRQYRRLDPVTRVPLRTPAKAREYRESRRSHSARRSA